MRKNKFLYEYYYFGDRSWYKRHNRHWMVFDQAELQEGEGTPRAKYAKTLAALLPFGKELKRPAFMLIEPSGSQFYIPITLINGKYSITILAIPDSGAQVACFNGELAAPLGIDLEKLKKAKSFEGPNKFQVDSYSTPLDIVVGSAKESRRVMADFLKSRYASTLLGWNAFFATHEVNISPEYGIRYRLI